MKRKLALTLVFVMLFALVACDKQEEDRTEGTNPIETSSNETTVATAEPTIATTEATEPTETVFIPNNGPVEYIPSQDPTEAPTQKPTQAPTQKPTQAPTQKPTQAPTQKPTQAPTQKPTQAPTQKPTQAPTQKPTQAPTQKPTVAPTQAPTEPAYTVYNISAIPQKSKDIAPATVKSFNGNITKEGQVDVYTYTAPRDGQYAYWFSEMRAGILVNVYVYDRLGEQVDCQLWTENGDSTAVDLEEGQTYTIKVYQEDGTGSYILNIGEQTPTTDISAYTVINDSLKFAEQENFYTFTPERDGNYAFGFTEVKSGIMLNLYIYDRLGEEIDCQLWAENGSFTAVELEAGRTYTVKVCQDTKYGNYTLNIGKQKETTNIVVKSIVNDSVEFDGQENIYTFTATDTSHTLTFSEMMSDLTIKVYVENYLEETVARNTYCENGTVIRMNKLTPGKQYTIRVCQDDGYFDNWGEYTFTLE